MNKVAVLDKGYVRLVKFMGTDLDVVNAARASFARESHELTERDIGLIRFLAREGHTSPFRHCWATFEIRAPIMVARQWWKHVVGSASIEEGTNWNETSRRYVTDALEFYVPEVWRSAPEHRKQGSGLPVSENLSSSLSQRLQTMIDLSAALYNEALEKGVAPEQARLFLPAWALYTTWRWTASLHAILHFIDLREAHDAQAEIRQYAEAIRELIQPIWPHAIEFWQEAERARRLAVQALQRGLSLEAIEQILVQAIERLSHER